MYNKTKAFLLSSSLLFCVNSAYAMWPVIDPASIQATVTQTKQLVEQYKILKSSYDQIVHSNDLLGLTIEKLSGHYGLGDYLNTADSIKYMNTNPETWLGVLNGLDRNLGKYTEYSDQHKENFNFVDDMDVTKIVKNSDFVKLYHDQKATGDAAYSLSAKMYEDSQDSIDKFKSLSGAIEQDTKNPNTKSATDLNTRVLIELGYQISLMNRQLALSNQMMALQLDSETYTTSNSVKQINKSNGK